MDLNTHKIINSHDVVFLENQFLNNINQKLNEKQMTVISDVLEDDEPLQTKTSDEDEEFHKLTDRTVEIEEVSATKRNKESGSGRSNKKWKPIVREDYVSYLTIEKAGPFYIG